MSIVLLLIGCSTDAPEAPTWYGEVQAIAERSCLGCHGDTRISGISLEGYDSFVAWSDLIYQEVSAGTMPPWLADGACAEYADDFSLTDAEVETLLSWIDSGMTPGTTAATPSGLAWEAPALERVDYTLKLPEAYVPRTHPDDYRCFLLEWPYAETVWVSGYEFRPGNEGIVHHAIPYIVEPDSADVYRALDEADPDPGYACYGSPGGDLNALINARWLGAWAPGGGASVLPEGSGLEILPGSLIALQMHYYSDGTAEGDSSTFDLQVETTPQIWTDLQPWTDVSWLVGEGMTIPAQSEGVSHQFSYEVKADEDFFIHSASIHMHTLGVSGKMSVTHADGSESCVLSLPNYDFNWQRGYRLDDPVWVEPGDTVELSCVWDNPGSTDITWGDGTEDEMCLGVTLITGD